MALGARKRAYLREHGFSPIQSIFNVVPKDVQERLTAAQLVSLIRAIEYDRRLGKDIHTMNVLAEGLWDGRAGVWRDLESVDVAKAKQATLNTRPGA